MHGGREASNALHFAACSAEMLKRTRRMAWRQRSVRLLPAESRLESLLEANPGGIRMNWAE
jgi:hypothetical protein